MKPDSIICGVDRKDFLGVAEVDIPLKDRIPLSKAHTKRTEGCRTVEDLYS